MVENLIILPEAIEDGAEAYTWYEANQPGLGEDFLRCIEACIYSIQRNPRMNPVVFESYRRALVRRFPYGIFYEFENDTVTIYSIFHCSQDPEKWRERLR